MIGFELSLGLGARPAPGGAIPRQTHVFLIAGQSNSTDRAAWDGGTDWPSHVYQLSRAAAPATSHADQQVIAASRPLDHWTQPYADGFGWSLQFVLDYSAAFPGANIVLVPAGKGGTSFAAGEWTRGTGALYLDAVARVNTLMGANPTWQFKGLLWHQGESDGDTAAEVAAYQAALDAALNGFRTDITAMTEATPIVLGEIPPGSVTPQLAAINAIIDDTPNRIAFSEVAGVAGTSIVDSYHFSAASMRIMGGRYFAALSGAQTNAPSAPGQVTGLNAAAGDGQVTLSWSAPSANRSPIIDYEIESSTDSGASWAILNDGISATTSFTATGLTNGLGYLYRVRAINAVGPGSISATAGATPVASGPSAESGAIGHWLFGSDNASYSGLAGPALSVVNSGVSALSNGYATLSGVLGSGLGTGLPETTALTFCGVVKIPSGAGAGQAIVFGNLKNGAGGTALFSDSAFKFNNYSGGGQFVSSTQGGDSIWTFIAASLDASGTVVVYIRSSGAASVTAGSVSRAAPYASALGIGPLYYTSASFAHGFALAEHILFDSAKSQAEIEAIYNRSATRLAARGITLGSA